jgi:hypothetical protein
MAVVYKSGILEGTEVTEDSTGWAFTLIYEVSGFSGVGNDRLIEALNAVPALGSTYSGSIPTGGAIVQSRRLLDAWCGESMAVAVVFGPLGEGTDGDEQKPTDEFTSKNISTTLQTFKEADDVNDVKIRMYFDPLNQGQISDKLILLDAMRPTLLRSYTFIEGSNPESIGEDTIGKCDPGAGEGEADFHLWIGWSMNATLRNDGDWNVTWVAAKNDKGWDPLSAYLNPDGEVPNIVDMGVVTGPEDIGTLSGPGAGESNGASRAQIYEAWDITGLPADVQSDF